MKEVKDCPKCGGEMQQGFLLSAPHWKAGRGMFGKTYRIFGYKCVKCNYVEFYVQEGKEGVRIV